GEVDPRAAVVAGALPPPLQRVVLHGVERLEAEGEHLVRRVLVGGRHVHRAVEAACVGSATTTGQSRTSSSSRSISAATAASPVVVETTSTSSPSDLTAARCRAAPSAKRPIRPVGL